MYDLKAKRTHMKQIKEPQLLNLQSKTNSVTNKFRFTMKKVLSFLLFAVIAISATQAQAQEFKLYVGEIKFRFQVHNMDEVYIIGFSTSNGKLYTSADIPEKITAPNGNKYKVTGICDDARISGGFTYIDIPKTVKFIGANAFGYCPYLKTVNIHGSPEVNINAFIQCTALEKVDIVGRRELGKTFPTAHGGKAEIFRYQGS